MGRMPSIFISHGPPVIVVSTTPASSFLTSLGSQFPRPRAIVSISAHWETVGPKVTAAICPAIIHDFPGPPEALDLTYGVKGAPEIAARVVALLAEKGIQAECDPERGLDHGTWIPLSMIYPQADVPVVQLSIQTEEASDYHYRLGEAIRPLADEGVLIMASGGAVHDLDEIHNYAVASPPPVYVQAFDSWLERMVTEGNTEALLQYQTQAPDAPRCHPYPGEHFLPLLISLGSKSGSKGQTLHQSFMYGTLSMAAFAWL